MTKAPEEGDPFWGYKLGQLRIAADHAQPAAEPDFFVQEVFPEWPDNQRLGFSGPAGVWLQGFKQHADTAEPVVQLLRFPKSLVVHTFLSANACGCASRTP